MERIWEEAVASSSRAEPQQINGSVYEFFAPKEKRPSVQIVFFACLQLRGNDRAQFATWLSGDESEIWLYWILDKIPNARILTVLYDAHATKTYEQGLMDQFRELLTDLIHAEVGQDGCPVVLVGHGLGGLVMKALCVQANSLLHGGPSDEAHIPVQNFLNHMRALFFFGTPHHGTTLADKSKEVVRSLIEDWSTDNNNAARRDEEFQNLRYRYGWETSLVAEGSHRPHSRQSSGFRRLSDFVFDVVKEDNEAHRGQKIGLPDELVGLQARIKLILEELKEAPRLGIVGMGGIGKTTLAKTVYNTISHKFEYSCFLQEVKNLFAKEESGDKLRATLVQNLYWKGRKVPEGFKWSTLEGKSVLIVLDDAETASQVRVMTNLDGFLEESRVIVTCRNVEFLRAERFKCRSAECLNFEDSKRLFCLHAFRESDTLNGFEKHLERIVIKCAGLPLALKVAGSYLFDLPKYLWDGAFEKLSRAQPLFGTFKDDLSSILTVSYNSLAPAEQEVFLDVATFFHGQSLNTAKKIWKVCGWEGVECSWQNLLDKGLVAQVPRDSSEDWADDWESKFLRNYSRNMDKLDQLQRDDEGVGDYIIQMHEVLRDLGRSKACPDPRYILDHTTVSYNVVNPAPRWVSNQGQPKVEVLKIFYRQGKDNSICMNISEFYGLNRLRILSLEGVVLEGSFHLFPCRLTYLKLMNVHFSSQSSSHESEQHKRLQYLDIERCSGFQTLPNCLEQLHNLKHLRISECDGLQVFLSLQSLQALEQLTIENCPSLKFLPDSLADLQSLQTLTIQSDELQALPDSLGDLQALKTLTIQSDELQALPESLGDLGALKTLTIQSHVLETLPDSLGHLQALKTLTIQSDKLQALPESLGDLGALKSLTIQSHVLETLPESLCHLQALETLTIQSGQLKTLPYGLGFLPALKTLTIQSGQLKTLPYSLRFLLALKTLTIQSDKLETLPYRLGFLRALKTLTIQSDELKTLPDSIGHLKALQTLTIQSDKLETLPYSLEFLLALKTLTIQSGKLETLPYSLAFLQALKTLTIQSHLLETLPDSLGHLQALKTLTIQSDELQALPDTLGLLQALQTLTIQSDKLKTLPGSLGRLQALKTLTIQSHVLETLPDSLGQLQSLQVLHIVAPLKAFPSTVGSLQALEYLHVCGGQMETLPDFIVDDEVDKIKRKLETVKAMTEIQDPHKQERSSRPDTLVKVPSSESAMCTGDPNLKMVEEFITEINIGHETGYFVSKAWMLSLGEHDNEALTSALRQTGYLEIYKTDTTVFYEKINDRSWTPENSDFSGGDTNKVIASNDNAAEGKIEQKIHDTEEYTDQFHLASQTKRREIADPEVIARALSFENKIQSAPVQNDQTAFVDSPKSMQDKGKMPLATSNEMLESFKTAIKDTSLDNYSVSTHWLSTLSKQEEENLKFTLLEAGHLEIGRTSTTTYFERLQGHVCNNPKHESESSSTFQKSSIVGGAGSSKAFQGSGGLLADCRQPPNIDNQGSPAVTTAIQESHTGEVACPCHPQNLTVSCRPEPSEGPSTSFPRGEHMRSVTRKAVRDCHVTMPITREGQSMPTGADKRISMETFSFPEQSAPVGNGFNEVSLEVSADSRLKCCLKSDPNDKKVRIEFSTIAGRVKIVNADPQTNTVVLRSVRSNVNAGIMRSGSTYHCEPIELYCAGRHPSLRVLKTCELRDENGQRRQDNLVWMQLSGNHPENYEIGSKTLELQCHVKNRLRCDRHDARVLEFTEGDPMILEGKIHGDLKSDMLLELNVRYQVVISYNEPRLPKPGQKFVATTRVDKPVDFDFVVDFRTREFPSSWSPKN